MKKSNIIISVVITIVILVSTGAITLGFRHIHNDTVKEEKKWCCEECKALHDEMHEKFGIIITEK